jgi:hypothetical protein
VFCFLRLALYGKPFFMGQLHHSLLQKGADLPIKQQGMLRTGDGWV